MSEFVLFSSNLPGAKYSTKAENDGQLNELIADAKTICLEKMFEYAPLDLAKVSIKPAGTIDELITIIESAKPSKIEATMRPALTRQQFVDSVSGKKGGDPIDFGYAYYMHLLLAKIFPQKIIEKGKPEKNEMRFAANYKGWMLVKKVNLAAEKKEIMAAMVSMNASLQGKAAETKPEYAAWSDKIEAAIEKYPERKSFGKAATILKDIKALGLPDSLKEYAISKALARVGFAPYITIDNVNENYPELKIPKPKGNFGKKKK